MAHPTAHPTAHLMARSMAHQTAHPQESPVQTAPQKAAKTAPPTHPEQVTARMKRIHWAAPNPPVQALSLPTRKLTAPPESPANFRGY